MNKWLAPVLFAFSTFSHASEVVKLKVGDKVSYMGSIRPKVGIVRNILKGNVIDISPNSTFFSFASAKKKYSDIGIEYRCSGNLCKGDRIPYTGSYGSQYSGTVLEIYSNGYVNIAPDADGIFGFIAPDSTLISISDLGYELDFYN